MESPLLEERPAVIDSSDWLTVNCLDWGRWRDKSGKRYGWKAVCSAGVDARESGCTNEGATHGLMTRRAGHAGVEVTLV